MVLVQQMILDISKHCWGRFALCSFRLSKKIESIFFNVTIILRKIGCFRKSEM